MKEKDGRYYRPHMKQELCNSCLGKGKNICTNELYTNCFGKGYNNSK